MCSEQNNLNKLNRVLCDVRTPREVYPSVLYTELSGVFVHNRAYISNITTVMGML